MLRAVLVKCMAADWPNMGRTNFFDHFEIQIQIIVGHFLQKVAMDQNWQCQFQPIGRNIFLYFNFL